MLSCFPSLLFHHTTQSSLLLAWLKHQFLYKEIVQHKHSLYPCIYACSHTHTHTHIHKEKRKERKISTQSKPKQNKLKPRKIITASFQAFIQRHNPHWALVLSSTPVCSSSCVSELGLCQHHHTNKSPLKLETRSSFYFLLLSF